MSSEEMELQFPPLPPEVIPKHSIAKQRRANNQLLFIIDDDPTGTQTVHDVPVLTKWSVDLIKREIELGSQLIFVLSNSRSLPEREAVELNHEIGANIKLACDQTGKRHVIISRSDSTLRGHYPAEVRALKASIDELDAPELIIPAFFEGGRITVNDIHYVLEGDAWMPAAMTHFAQDRVFGYRHSNLRNWLVEKCHGTLKENNIGSISLTDLRSDDEDSLRAKLHGLQSNSVTIVNATDPRDLRKLASVLTTIDKKLMYRSAASFVSAMADQAKKDYLHRASLDLRESKGGLIIVGSYVPKTTSQLTYLKNQLQLISIEIDVADLLNGATPSPLEVARKISDHIDQGNTVVLSTSRALVSGASDEENLKIGKETSNYLTNTIKRLSSAPKYILTKGGITSSDVATDGLGMQRAWVLGQIIPGVPVWQAGDLSKFPHIHQVVFPGNVGDASALWQVINLLERK